MIRPEFLKVPPEDIQRYDWAAFVVSLVRFATARNDERDGRVEIDGQVWWRVSYADIGVALGGVGRGKVRGAVEKLEATGKLRSIEFADDDRTRAYRVVDVPKVESNTHLSSQRLKSARGVLEPAQGCSGTSLCTTTPKEEKKGRSAAGEPATPTTPNPSTQNGKEQTRQPDPLVCPDHPDGDTGEPCGGCARVKAAARRTEAETAEAQRLARDARRQAINACGLCDNNGMREFPTGLDHCDHPERGRIDPLPDPTAEEPDEDRELTPEQFMALLEARMGLPQ